MQGFRALELYGCEGLRIYTTLHPTTTMSPDVQITAPLFWPLALRGIQFKNRTRTNNAQICVCKHVCIYIYIYVVPSIRTYGINATKHEQTGALILSTAEICPHSGRLGRHGNMPGLTSQGIMLSGRRFPYLYVRAFIYIYIYIYIHIHIYIYICQLAGWHNCY